jgi:hypothetical protein
VESFKVIFRTKKNQYHSGVHLNWLRASSLLLSISRGAFKEKFTHNRLSFQEKLQFLTEKTESFA